MISIAELLQYILAVVVISFLISGSSIFAEFVFKYGMGFFGKSKHKEGNPDDRD